MRMSKTGMWDFCKFSNINTHCSLVDKCDAVSCSFMLIFKEWVKISCKMSLNDVV